MARKCLILIVLICVLKTLLDLLTIFTTSLHDCPRGPSPSGPGNHTQTPWDQDRAENVPEMVPQWRPSHSMVTRVLRELNLTQEEAALHLPFTLRSKLWINNANVCRDTFSGLLDTPDILFLVHSTPDLFHRRLRVRSTVADETYFSPFKIRVVFLLGRVGNPSLQQALETEHGLYQDLVQGDFLDSDLTLSHKGVLGFRWAWQYCRRARFVVKLNDDIFFDTFKMLLQHRIIFEGRQRSLFCHVLPQNTMPIYREHDHGWAVEENLFQGLSYFPYHYCSGLVVVMTSDLVPALFRAAFFTPVFWIEDVYLFGMLPAMLGDVTMVHLGHRHAFVDLNTTSAVMCMKREHHSCKVLATVGRTREEWETLWNLTSTLHLDPSWRVPFLTLPAVS
ncbi:hypothetical protein ACOMHN_021757 [Nucella lapillus]